jgi:hypothetical protein
MLTWITTRTAICVAMCGAVLLADTSCQGPSATPPKANDPASEKSQRAEGVSEPVEPSPPEDLRIPAELHDPDRWLFVEKPKDGVEGAWATGSFNRKRNRLTIRERDVQQFAIDTSRVPIDWERLVVISINGRTSELRKRDYPFLHFFRDDHGQWVVREP